MDPPGWYGALGDAVAGPTLRAMHEDPAHPWTTAEQAVRAGVSRTTLAKRFIELVAEGPVAHLTEWQMTLASDLPTRPELTVAAVPRRVRYADAFGFSAAFKRLRGESPTAFRRTVTDAGRAEPGRAAPGPGSGPAGPRGPPGSEPEVGPNQGAPGPGLSSRRQPRGLEPQPEIGARAERLPYVVQQAPRVVRPDEPLLLEEGAGGSPASTLAAVLPDQPRL